MSNGHAQLAEAMRRQGSSPSHAYSQPRQATISSYDPGTHAVKVMLQPENIESNWMPLAAIGVGNGWGIVCGPQIGDQVHVSFAEGDFHSGIVVGRVFSTAAMPPPVPSGEFWLVHSSGSLLKFMNNGDVQVTTSRDLLATVGRNVTVTATGTIALTGAAIALNAAAGIALNGPLTQGLGTNGGAAHLNGPLTVDNEVTAVTTPLHSHAHTGVTSGPSNTGAPTP